MTPYRNTRISFKLGISFAAILILLCAVIAFAWVQADKIGESSREFATGSLQKVLLARTAQEAAQAGATELHSLFLLQEQARRVSVYGQIDRNTKIRDGALAELLASTGDVEEREALADVARKRDTFVAAFNKTVDAVELNINEAHLMMLQETMPALDNMLLSLDKLVALQSTAAKETISNIHVMQVHSQQAIMILGIAAVLVACLSAFAITRSIARPIAETVRFADAIASGDLHASLPSPNKDEIGTLVTALDRMRQKIDQREQRIADLAYRDAITKLPNRTLFNDHLRQAVKVAARAGHAMSILIVNLDRFRQVNEVLGHEMGDELLRQVAAVMRSVFVREADIIARLGGDQFAVLLPANDSVGAMVVAKRLLTAIEAPIILRDQPVDVSASIGIATCPDHGMEAEKLMSCAEIAMHVAKQRNGDATLFESRFEPNTEHALSLMGQLRRAIEQEELILYYQPKVSLSNEICHSVEALVRWQHPTRGFIPPDHFIPFAERTGYIRAITRWVLEKACTQIRRWHTDGLRIEVHVNISTRDLVHQDLPSIVEELLHRNSIAAEWLGLEITESAIMEDMVHALDSLTRLNAMGVKLSIDDFGAGYSSLNYLKRLPVQNIKIDKSFVMNMVNDPGDAVIIKSTIELGHNMGLKVIAEGIENQDVWNKLRALGCDEAQGYFISRPLPIAQLEAWFREKATSTLPGKSMLCSP